MKKIIDETLEERLKHKELLRQRRQLRKHDVGGDLTSNKILGHIKKYYPNLLYFLSPNDLDLKLYNLIYNY